MSAVCIMTPLVIASWPAISAAVAGALASMGFSAAGPHLHKEQQTGRTVETPLENSTVTGEFRPGEKIRVVRDDVVVEVGQDARGRCTVCVSGRGYSDRELRRIGAEVSGRIVQQYTYHKLLTELKSRSYRVVGEEVLGDQSIRVRVRL